MDKIEDTGDAEKMALYQITFNGSKYCYLEYSYDKLADAINYAKKNPQQNIVAGKTEKHHSADISSWFDVIGGSGWPLAIGNSCLISLVGSNLYLRPTYNNLNIEIPLSELIKMDIFGPGTVSTNAGIVGGGFGLEGAAIGILAAKAINSATQRTSTTTFLHIATREAEIFIQTSQYEPMNLRMLLSKAFVQTEANKLMGFSKSPSAEIRRLHNLMVEKIITEDEFQVAKSQILEI